MSRVRRQLICSYENPDFNQHMHDCNLVITTLGKIRDCNLTPHLNNSGVMIKQNLCVCVCVCRNNIIFPWFR